MIYIVQSVAGDGDYVLPNEAQFSRLDDARAEARRRLGLSRLHPARLGGLPDDEENGLGAVEMWCEQTMAEADRTGFRLGGVGIYRIL